MWAYIYDLADGQSSPLVIRPSLQNPPCYRGSFLMNVISFHPSNQWPRNPNRGTRNYSGGIHRKYRFARREVGRMALLYPPYRSVFVRGVPRNYICSLAAEYLNWDLQNWIISTLPETGDDLSSNSAFTKVRDPCQAKNTAYRGVREKHGRFASGLEYPSLGVTYRKHIKK